MNMQISKAAAEFIIAKGGVVKIVLDQRSTFFGWCGPREIPCPSVRLGKPPDKEAAQYQAVVADGIVFHVHSACSALLESNDIRLEIESVFFGKKLVLYGIKIENY